MELKKISLSIPDNLLEASKEYSKEFGYKNVQEFILELIRMKVFLEKIEQDMKKGRRKIKNCFFVLDYLVRLKKEIPYD
jgi:metal-responsive CopG/Arc/MetJ family transcriptional regulator